MSSGITTFTALKLEDKDVSDPNSGFYTTQATQEQIDAIPADSKAEGELIYNKTTGSLVLYSKAEDEDEGEWKTLVTTASSNGEIEDTELVAKSHSNSQAPLSPAGLIYYNTDDHNFKAIDDDIAISGSHTKTIVTTPDHEGNLVAKVYRNATPSTTRDGLIYYDNNDYKKNFKVRENDNELRTIVTTKDEKGYLVAKTTSTSNTPAENNGLIYYDHTNNNFKVRENSDNHNTIVTTSDAAGYLVVKHYEDTVSTGTTTRTDPTSVQNGQIYYNTQDHAFRAYSNGNWNYFSTKPQIFVHFYSGYPFPGRADNVVGPAPTTLPTSNAYIEVNGYNGEDGYYHNDIGIPDSDLDAVIASNSFLFEIYGTSGIKFTGHYDTSCQIVISFTGSCINDGLSDSTVKFQAYKAHADGSNSTVIDYALLDVTYKNSNDFEPTTVDLRFGHTFTPTFPVMILKVSHISSSFSIDLLIHDYSVSCTS